MAKRYALLGVIAVLIVIAINFSITDTSDALTFATQPHESVVNKTPGGTFTVKITFKNTGETEGNWSVNIAFEDSSWVQVGTSKTLTLKSGSTETLTWTGVVPANAPVNSMARLVVYYDDSFKPLNWWIRVVPGGELTIKSSIVE
jgi:hypothetical protein